ncbi:MAG TPA: hypothetical protein VJU16_02575, partial [Planctomycetota bacterium]|nr:hypothetical protein [Planctomycetota bacterium]
MILLTLALAVLSGPVQEDVLTRQRIEKLIPQWEAEQADEKAIREIDFLPTSTIPLLLELAPADKFPRASKRIADKLPPAPWGRFLKTNIGYARSLHEMVSSGRHFDRNRVLFDVVVGIACLPPAEAKTILDGFGRDKNPVFQELAKDVSAFLQPDMGANFGRLLGSPASCERGADLVILSGETGAIRQAVELFCRQEEPESMAAARVLEVFGAGPHADRILSVFQGKGRYAGSDWAIRILVRTGGKRVEDALLAALKTMPSGNPRGYTIIWALQALDCQEAGPAIRAFIAGIEKNKLKSLPAVPLLGVESAIQRLGDIRREDSRFGPMRLNELHRYAYPGLRPAVLEWAKDPNAKPSELKWLLPVLGAAGAKEDAAFLLEKLQVPRCADGAAEGLAMIGDPAHARAVWKAYSNAGPASFLNNSMVSFPAEALEQELVAAISNSSILDRRVLQLLRQGETAAIRKALFDRMLDPNPRGILGWDAALLLGQGKNDEEKAWVEKLRTLGARTHGHYGHFLAMRQGDASAAVALAEFLSTQGGLFRDPRAPRAWKACEAAGENWKKAVEAAWNRNPDWTE